MTSSLAAGPTRLVLPPGFREHVVDPASDVYAEACRLATSEEAEAATLVVGAREDPIAFAVVLAPDEPLVSARRAFFAGMASLADAVGTHGPPEIPVTFDWPGTLLFNGARLGGGRLGWPQDCPEESEPDWLVFSAMLIGSKAAFGDPGHTPSSTALDEEGFGTGLRTPLIESFARHLTKAFEVWREDGFERLAARYLARLRIEPGTRLTIDGEGDGRLICPNGLVEHLALRPALLAPAWHDPATGGVRL